MKTAVANPPTASNGMSMPSRSSTILGNATEIVLNTKPALSATMTNSTAMMAAIVGDSKTSGARERAAA